MARYIAILFAVGSCVCALAQETPAPVPLRVGLTDCYADRLPVNTFRELHPELDVQIARWPRNPWDAYREKPLNRTHEALPHVIDMIVGPYADDLVQLADRGLIEPLDDRLGAWGVSKDDFLPHALEAVTYRGHIWAVPHHAVLHALRYHRGTFAENGLPTTFGSWQEMFDSLAEVKAPDGTTAIPFSAPFGAYRLAAYMALRCGAPPLDLATLDHVDDPRLQTALELVKNYQRRGVIQPRPDNWPLRREAHIAAGLDHVDSLYPSVAYGVMPTPTRLLQGDAPAKSPNTLGNLQAFAVRRHSPEARAGVDAFFRWLLSGEADLLAFEHSNIRVPQTEWVMDLVHVPLRESVLADIDFEYVRRKYPEYEHLVELVRDAVFARHPPALERATVDLLVQHIELRLMRDPLDTVLPELKAAAYELIATTPVESLAYREY